MLLYHNLVQFKTPAEWGSRIASPDSTGVYQPNSLAAVGVDGHPSIPGVNWPSEQVRQASCNSQHGHQGVKPNEPPLINAYLSDRLLSARSTLLVVSVGLRGIVPTLLDQVACHDVIFAPQLPTVFVADLTPTQRVIRDHLR